MNIRIGNDIKVKFTIRGPQGFDKLNVKQMRVYFVNTAFENTDVDCAIRKRFPKEPFPQFYTPSKYAIHGCGPWHYHCTPRKIDYATFCPGFHDAHIWPYYNGFGITPDKFSNCHCGLVSGKPKGDAFDPVFLAPSKLVDGDNKAEAYFPAYDQIMCGPYKMVVVLVMYESGWARNDLHTYTIDYGVLFNIVDDETGTTGDIVIDGDTGELEGNKILRMYFAKSDYYVDTNTKLNLGDSDRQGNPYKLYTVMDNGTVLEYLYTIWSDSRIQFESSDSTVVVSYGGDLIINDSTDNGDVMITARDPESGNQASCTIHINSIGSKEYIGFANTEDASELDLLGDDAEGRKLFTAVENVEGNQHVTNYNTGYYLWIISKTPIKDVNCQLLDVPLAEVQRVDGNYYCYHCPNRLIATSFDLTIER